MGHSLKGGVHLPLEHGNIILCHNHTGIVDVADDLTPGGTSPSGCYQRRYSMPGVRERTLAALRMLFLFLPCTMLFAQISPSPSLVGGDFGLMVLSAFSSCFFPLCTSVIHFSTSSVVAVLWVLECSTASLSLGTTRGGGQLLRLLRFATSLAAASAALGLPAAYSTL